MHESFSHARLLPVHSLPVLLHAFCAKRQGASCRQAAVKGCRNPTPCWTRQIQARPNQSCARCSVFVPPPASRGQTSCMAPTKTVLLRKIRSRSRAWACQGMVEKDRPDAERSGEQAEGLQPQKGRHAAQGAVVDGVQVGARVAAGVQVDAQVALYVARHRSQHRLLQRRQNLVVVCLQLQPTPPMGSLTPVEFPQEFHIKLGLLPIRTAAKELRPSQQRVIYG